MTAQGLLSAALVDRPLAGYLLTGGSGRLGTELQALLPGLLAPPRSTLDVTDAEQTLAFICDASISVVIHAAAYTDVLEAETERELCWEVNVAGTRNVARAAREAGALLVHISTDYVFAGTKGDYAEDDVPGPALNHYALTKIVAEEAARRASRNLILRTSFRSGNWPHPVAFNDLFTSQDYLDVLGPQLALAAVRAPEIPHDILHVAGPRRSALELARLRSPAVQAASRATASVNLPADITLNTNRWQSLLNTWQAAQPHEGVRPA